MKLNPFLRQWRYPKEFRIAAPEWPEELPFTLDKLISNLSSSGNPQVGLLAEVATGLWRMRLKMLQPGTNLPAEEMRRAYRHLESTLDALSNAGIRIQDHTGEPVPDSGGIQLKVLAYQPLAGVTRKRVQETIKPSVYYKEQMIQMGEVIVSIPLVDQSPKSFGGTSHAAG